MLLTLCLSLWQFLNPSRFNLFTTLGSSWWTILCSLWDISCRTKHSIYQLSFEKTYWSLRWTLSFWCYQRSTPLWSTLIKHVLFKIHFKFRTTLTLLRPFYPPSHFSKHSDSKERGNKTLSESIDQRWYLGKGCFRNGFQNIETSGSSNIHLHIFPCI